MHQIAIAGGQLNPSFCVVVCGVVTLLRMEVAASGQVAVIAASAKKSKNTVEPDPTSYLRR